MSRSRGNKPVPTKPKTCEQCGQRYERRRHPNGKLEKLGDYEARRYCSLGCQRRANAEAMRKYCAHCGEELVRKVYGKSDRTKRVESGTEFDKRKFCSSSCNAKQQHKVGDRDREYTKTCPYCEQPFGRKRYGEQNRLEGWYHFEARKFCSRFCTDKYASKIGGYGNTPKAKPAKERKRKPSLQSAGVGRSEMLRARVRKNWTVRKDDYWKFGDSLWHPTGCVGPALTQKLKRRLDQQVEWVRSRPELMKEMRQTGMVEAVLLEAFKRARKEELLYGTVRRVTEMVQRVRVAV